MNWGHKITFLYLSFVAVIITMVTICIKQDDLHLVSKNYYEEEIAYQNQIDKMKVAEMYATDLNISVLKSEGVALINYPDNFKNSLENGKLVFFRPSDANMDVTLPMVVGEGEQKISVEKLEKGLWKVKMTGRTNGKDFYKEQAIVL
jgi:cell division septal protein FtsQ